MTAHDDLRNDSDPVMHSSHSSQSSATSPQPAHESRHERAARIRQNQRRCRERKLAYVSSLEERIRAYESSGVQASIPLQNVAKKLDLENKKLKKICTEALELSENDIERCDVNLLIENVKARISTPATAPDIPPSSTLSTVFSKGRNSSASASICSGGSTHTSGFDSSPGAHLRSQKPPTPAPIQDDGPVLNDPSQQPLLTIAPSTNCGDGLDHAGKRFCGLLQLLAYEILSTGSMGLGACSDKTVTCRVSYELLKTLIDEQDSLGVENAAFTLKDGVRIATDGNGFSIDANVLLKVLEDLRTSNVGYRLDSASIGMLVRNSNS